MTEHRPRTPRRAPLYGDDSPSARLYWLHKALAVYEHQAEGHHAASNIMEDAKARIPEIRAEIERLEGPPPPRDRGGRTMRAWLGRHVALALCSDRAGRAHGGAYRARRAKAHGEHPGGMQ